MSNELYGHLVRIQYELGRAGVAASQDDADKPIAVSLELVRECLSMFVSAASSPARDEMERVAVAIWAVDFRNSRLSLTEQEFKAWEKRRYGKVGGSIYGDYARAAISALRQRAAMDDLLRMDGELYDLPERAAPKLSEEERARVEEVRAWLAANEASNASTSMDSLQAAYACDHLTELLYLIDKLTEVG